MTTVQLTPVLLHVAITPEYVEARVRTYAGDIAIREESFYFSDEELTKHAIADGRATWDERDICALTPLDGAMWSGSESGQVLRQDIALTPDELRALLSTQIASLEQRLAAVPE